MSTHNKAKDRNINGKLRRDYSLNTSGFDERVIRRDEHYDCKGTRTEVKRTCNQLARDPSMAEELILRLPDRNVGRWNW